MAAILKAIEARSDRKQMINFFLLSMPIFSVIGVGWATTRARLVAQGALDSLSAFSFRFALPALLLRLIASLPSAGNIYVLAQRMMPIPPQVSAAILLSTLVSVVCFPCGAWLALD